jgi:hypothetical protein
LGFLVDLESQIRNDFGRGIDIFADVTAQERTTDASALDMDHVIQANLGVM